MIYNTYKILRPYLIGILISSLVYLPYIHIINIDYNRQLWSYYGYIQQLKQFYRYGNPGGYDNV